MIHVESAPGAAGRVAALEASLRTLDTTFRSTRDYAAQVKDARKTWKKALSKESRIFDEVRDLLGSMYPGGLAACMYCEGPEASQIDHFRAMSWFPNEVFEWINYIHACSVCNTRKGSKLRLLGTRDNELRYARPRGSTPVPPPNGSPLLINPRSEDPMRFLKLDLGTGMLVESSAKGCLEYRRANHTLQKLGLNDRQLPEQRAALYQSLYRAQLRDYVTARQSGTAATRPALNYLTHRLIWEEMKRQPSHPDLAGLFTAAPEALGW